MTQEDPKLQSDEREYEVSKRRTRSAVFSRKIKNLYNNKCAICGSKRMSPEGNPEVEAAHIFPKEENGVDDLRNGISLCKLHHWAFDCGWIALTDDLEILVKTGTNEDVPGDILDLDGKEVNLPNDLQYKPHKKFIRAHRRLQGFQ